MTIEEISVVVNSVLSVLSFFLAAISVITVIVSLKQNGKMIQLNNEQISEMRKEHELSLQPVIIFLDPQFVIEKPRLFYSPPEDEYSIISRFRFRLDAQNISSAVAVNIVCTGLAKSYDNQIALVEEASSKRINVLSDNFEKIDFMFLEKKNGVVFDCLRDGHVSMIPQIELETVFLNTTGGAFRMRRAFLVFPIDEELEDIKRWHSIVASANADYKEYIRNLKRDNDQELFTQLKEKIDQRGGEKEEVLINCKELDECFTYEPITIEEYKKIVGSRHFSRFVGYGVDECKVSANKKR